MPKYNHIILISSSYTLGHRIAWHFASPKSISKELIVKIRRDTKAILGEPYYSVHRLSTDSPSWESVVERDSYFSDLYVQTDLVTFLETIKKDFTFTALDVAKYLLANLTMSHLKLQKLIYFVYAEYLVRYKKPLFDDPILAYKYGPVVQEVYDIYKNFGAKNIEPTHEGEDEQNLESAFDINLPIVHARLAKTANKSEILDVLEFVVATYGDMDAWELVALTHRPSTPWCRTQPSQRITDDMILKYHHFETI